MLITHKGFYSWNEKNVEKNFSTLFHPKNRSNSKKKIRYITMATRNMNNSLFD